MTFSRIEGYRIRDLEDRVYFAARALPQKYGAQTVDLGGNAPPAVTQRATLSPYALKALEKLASAAGQYTWKVADIAALGTAAAEAVDPVYISKLASGTVQESTEVVFRTATDSTQSSANEQAAVAAAVNQSGAPAPAQAQQAPRTVTATMPAPATPPKLQ